MTPLSVTPLHAAPRVAFPFTALVGQQTLQQALLLVAIDPRIGGVLISGPRGTAKSTAARALAALLPNAPFVTLPLAASLEQVVGTLSVEDALRDGTLRLSPGLVARAHLGVLYVDEANLLPDALVDALLDVAASGVNTVERDGISQQHAARFVLVGTMNPEEGDIRPQLLDRFGLSVRLDNPRDPQQRHTILRTRLAFDDNPQALMAEHADALSSLVTQVLNARTALPTLHWSDAVLHHAAQLALAAGVDGVRADLVMLRAARAHAALQGHGSVTEHDVDAVAELALAHRRSEHAPPAKPPAPHSPPPMPAPTSAPSEGEPTEAPQSESSPAQGDWGAMAPLPSDTTRVASIGGWPAKKP
ncbi:MAG: ATP-binding protein [Rhodoferax sp.]|nr:ATP-binding protein [Rhodoferax sp.]MBP7490576.1 ATP-binding protein [Rhodoferax sp.]